MAEDGEDQGQVVCGPFDRTARRRVFRLLLGAPFQTRSGHPWANPSINAAVGMFAVAGIAIGVAWRSAAAGIAVGLGLLAATTTAALGLTWALVRQAGGHQGRNWRLYERARPGQAPVVAVLRLHPRPDGRWAVTDLAASPTNQGAGGALIIAVQAEGRPLVLSAGPGVASWYHDRGFVTSRRGWWIVPPRLSWSAGR